MVVPVHGMFYEHLLSVKVLKGVKGVPFFFCLGRYKSTLDKTTGMMECMDKWEKDGARKSRKENDKNKAWKGSN